MFAVLTELFIQFNFLKRNELCASPLKDVLQ
jgi:hypothetical protein